MLSERGCLVTVTLETDLLSSSLIVSSPLRAALCVDISETSSQQQFILTFSQTVKPPESFESELIYLCHLAVRCNYCVDPRCPLFQGHGSLNVWELHLFLNLVLVRNKHFHRLSHWSFILETSGNFLKNAQNNTITATEALEGDRWSLCLQSTAE